MDKLLIIANWKSNKTNKEALEFLEIFKKNIESLDLGNKEIILCPSFHSLSVCANFIKENNLPISLGAQNISEFGEGQHTGEVSASQIKDIVKFVIVGHSERRNFFFETDDQIQQKAIRASDNGLSVILCVQNSKTKVFDEAKILAYEPIGAIGTGNPEDPEDVKKVFDELSVQYSGKKLLYGGSVTPEVVGQYMQNPHLAGFLVGGASLDPETFTKLVQAC